MKRRVVFFSLLFTLTILMNGYVASAKEMAVPLNKSIQEIIRTANSGDTIFVPKGVYEGNLTIDKSISLFGEEGAVIKGIGKGDVIDIKAPHVKVKGFKISNSGKLANNAGIAISSSHVEIIDNQLEDVLYGIYVNEGVNVAIKQNQISSHPEHFSKRGNGIHLFHANNAIIQENRINQVQDGVYIEGVSDIKLENNVVEQSRYGLHFMYVNGGKAVNNRSLENITGYMVMGVNDVAFIENQATKNLDYRGYGMLIYDSEKIDIKRNDLIINSSGITLQDAREINIYENTIAGNMTGLILKDTNEDIELINNNFIGNVIQSKIESEFVSTEFNGAGNYWDDYDGLDLNGDSIGEIPYTSGSMYDQLVGRSPIFQFYFESPSIKLWSAIEKLLPVIGSNSTLDQSPRMLPISFEVTETTEKTRNYIVIIVGFVLLICSAFIFRMGRN